MNRPTKKYQNTKPYLETKEANETLLYALIRIKGRLHRLPPSAEKSAIEKEIKDCLDQLRY